jgi:hypothetical protein
MIMNSIESNTVPASRLSAKVVRVADLSNTDRERMFRLMTSYYDSVDEAQFVADLSKKDSIILLRDTSNDMICGFSTLVTVNANMAGRKARAVFSGDTVIDKAYWGQRALGKAFLRYLLIEKLKRPFEPLYWLLITKGYKTYLMMANNFAEYYPRFDKSTPVEIKKVMDAFYTTLYAESYDLKTGLIELTGNANYLKSGVAGISEELIESNPRVAFFQKANPQWHRGVELACIARMTFLMPLRYALKSLITDFLIKPVLNLLRPAPQLPDERRRTID